jgi:hypothetical protein
LFTDAISVLEFHACNLGQLSRLPDVREVTDLSIYYCG